VTAGLLVALILAAAPAQEVVQPSQGEYVVRPLRLDAKTQVPGVQQALSEAQTEAAPVVQRMLQLREQMLNLAMAGRAAELEAASGQYATAAAALAALEAKAFASIYGQLRDNQKSRAIESFGLMGGLFLPAAHIITAAPAGGRAGGPGGGGGGR
jgi:hypothetical protein